MLDRRLFLASSLGAAASAVLPSAAPRDYVESFAYPASIDDLYSGNSVLIDWIRCTDNQASARVNVNRSGWRVVELPASWMNGRCLIDLSSLGLGWSVQLDTSY